MLENIRIIKSWYKIAKPSKKYFAVASTTSILARLCNVIEPIFAANVIINMTNGNFGLVMIFLSLAFLFIVVRNIFWQINYVNYAKLIGSSYLRIQNKIFDKVIKCHGKNFKKNSKEKLINIIHTDVFTLGEFADLITVRIARLIMVLVSFVIVFRINSIVGSLLVVITIVNYFILNSLNTKIASSRKKMAESRDLIFENFADVVNNKNMIKDLNIVKEQKKEYIKNSNKFIYNLQRESVLVGHLDNTFFVFYQTLIYLITLFLVFLVTRDAINITLYFIIVPYLAQVMEMTTDFMSILTEIKTVNVASSRVKTILNFSEREMVDFGNNIIRNVDGTIEFKNVSFEDKKSIKGKLDDVTFKIYKKKVNMIYGERNSGKRIIFYMLRRIFKPKSGNIYLDNVDIYELSSNNFEQYINFTSYKPPFLNGGIMKNLRYFSKDTEEIISVCKELGIHDYINTLPGKYRFNINKNSNYLSEEKKYLISLARALLTKSEVIMLYEFPINISQEEEVNLKNILKKISKERTVIIFTALPEFMNFADKIIEIKNGKIV